MNTTTRDELHHLIGALPERTLDAAAAFLTFLRDRTVAVRPQPELLRSADNEPGWAADERRGLEVRRQQRDAAEDAPDPDG